MKINMDSLVKIKLTDNGIERVKGSYEYIVMKTFKINENNEIIISLPCVFHIFGKHISEVPFVNNEIEIMENQLYEER